MDSSFRASSWTRPFGATGDVATFVTLRAAGSALREALSPVRWPGTPSRAGIARKPRGIDLTPYTETSAVPSGEEPNDRLDATSPPRKMAIAMLEQRSPGDPGDRGGMSPPAGHRFCADAVVSYYGKGTPGRCLGSSGIPPVAPPHGPGAIEMRLARGGQGGPSTR